MNRLRRFVQLPGPNRWLFLEAYILTGIMRLMILTVPLRCYAPYLGIQWSESPRDNPPGEYDRLLHIGREVRRAARHTPWQSKCLVQALTAKMMLKRRRIASTIYFGVAKDEGQRLEAHAWLRCGKLFLTGQHSMRRFKVVSTFAEQEHIIS